MTQTVSLASLASANTTTLTLLHPVTEDELPVKVTGFTPDSKEWKAAEKDLVDPNKPQSLILEKKKTKIDLDPKAAEQRKSLLISVITDITGLDDWKFTKPACKKLLSDPNYQWILEQWGEHLDDRSNFFGKPEKPATSG